MSKGPPPRYRLPPPPPSDFGPTIRTKPPELNIERLARMASVDGGWFHPPVGWLTPPDRQLVNHYRCYRQLFWTCFLAFLAAAIALGLVLRALGWR